MVARSLPAVCFQKPPRARKVKSATEIVTHCDGCGKALGRSCARTPGSAVCAAGCGIPTRRNGESYRFFCSTNCADAQ